jgi:hypothetical protein
MNTSTTPDTTPDTTSEFSEFLNAAAPGSNPQPAMPVWRPADHFDTIEAAAKIFHEQLEKIEAAFKETASRNPFKQNTGNDYYDNPFKSIKEDTLHKFHEKASQLLHQFYRESCLIPTGRTIDNNEPQETFCKATRFQPSHRIEHPPLNQITAAGLRETFFQLYGDPVESRVQQLRQLTARYLCGHRPPFNDQGILSFYTGLHRETLTNPKQKQLTHHYKNITDFTNFLRLCHFAHTGEFISPDESWKLKQPYGTSRNTFETFDNALLFKRQTNPASGIRWLRFTASNYVDILLEPKVETYFRALIKDHTA